MAELLFFKMGELQMRAAVPAAGLVLGRGADADLVLPDKAVSRTQCALVPRGAGYALVDKSGRGTSVSHRMAGEGGTLLKDGDELHLGAFTVVYSAARAPEEPSELTRPPSGRRGRTAAMEVGPQGKLAAPRRARLRHHLPEGEGLVPLKPEEGWSLVVGADPQGASTLKLQDSHLSAAHFKLFWREGHWRVADLHSRNGTWVDGLRIQEAWLGPRATLRAGETTLYFEQDAGERGSSHEVLPGLVSRDANMRTLVDQIRTLAPSRVSVTIHGETGTGKEVVARALHQLSPRRERPFVAINCGALARDLVESELFGHEKGAFTGADRTRLGAFEEADGGTLFLDEMGELPLAVQAKLLRVLELGEVRRLGGSRTSTVDVRMVCATHVDLLAAVENGAFREDLYYRLCVAPVELPPLRQRVADVVPLAEHFLRQLSPGDGRITLGADARVKLEGHRWPGNARELRNVIQVALLQRSGPTISEADLVLRPAARKGRGGETLRLAGRTLQEIEREVLRLALERHDGDRTAAMTELAIPRSTFFRKLEEFGLTER